MRDRRRRIAAVVTAPPVARDPPAIAAVALADGHPERESRRRMSPGRDRCPACSRLLISTRFDTTFRMPDQSERLCFGIPGGLCSDCDQLYKAIELIGGADSRALPVSRRAPVKPDLKPASSATRISAGKSARAIAIPPIAPTA